MVLEYLRTKFSDTRHRLSEWDRTRRHLPDLNDYKKWRLAAVIITRIGFFSKAILYSAIGVISIIASTSQARHPEGPQSVIATLESTFGQVVVAFFVIGLFCYCLFALFYSVLDFDQIGLKGAGNKLKRFGRLFSAGFYGFIGVAGVQILLNVHRDSDLLKAMFRNTIGKAFLCILGIIFLAVSVVYFIYIWRPEKFKRELASERMHPKLFYFCVVIARIGALGRSLFFGSFGTVLIIGVKEVDQHKPGNLTILSLEGVLTRLAYASPRFLFVIAVLLIFYALWSFILCIFRRLPAHVSARDSLNVLGLNRRLKLLEKEVKLLKLSGLLQGSGEIIQTDHSSSVREVDTEKGLSENRSGMEEIKQDTPRVDMERTVDIPASEEGTGNL